MTKPVWKMKIADDLDPKTAERLGSFITSFQDPDDPDGRCSHSGETYLWKITRNPLGRGYVTLAMHDGEIVGSLTLTRRKIYFKGEAIIAAELGDGFTNPKYERQNIFTSLIKASRERAMQEGIRIVYGVPSDIALPVHENKCQNLRKRGLDLFLHLMPLTPVAAASQLLGGREHPLLQRSIDDTYRLILRSGLRLIGRNCIESPLAFDSDFDELDNSIRQRYHFYPARAAEDLSYRIGESPDRERYQMLVHRTAQGKLGGYLIAKSTTQRGIKVLYVADIHATSNVTEARLWACCLLRAMENGFDLVATWLPLRAASFLSHLPLPPVPIKRKEVIFWDHDLGSEVLQSEGPMKFSLLDSDSI